MKGLSLHCANGIIIQSLPVVLSQPESASVPALSQTVPEAKPKMFKAMAIEILVYVQIKRQNIENLSNIERNMFEMDEQRSFAMDTMWIIAKCQANIANVQQNIHNWTGFNYMLCHSVSDPSSYQSAHNFTQDSIRAFQPVKNESVETQVD